MYRTRNDIPDNARKSSIAILQSRLADSIDLGTQAKHAHWNVKGPQFIALHGLFDVVADATADWSDTIAERLVALGGIAAGTATMVAQNSQLPAYPWRAITGRDHIDALAASLALFGKLVRANISETAEPDATTSDVLTEVSRAADKHLWLVEAHGQARA
jgi:starvation-inducible DNA-binding protein